jgi:pimeloyl-ACP methyl ester carboxylesterase
MMEANCERPSLPLRTMLKASACQNQQIRALWQWGHSLKDSYDDMNFTPADLAKIRASTLIVQSDRDFPSCRSVVRDVPRDPNSSLWIVPGGSYGPRAERFAQAALGFLCGSPRSTLDTG